MEYTVISYWIGETEKPKVWLYPTKEAAEKGLFKLWKQSFNLACEDENFDEENSYHKESFGIITWNDEVYRYFEVVKVSTIENIF